MKERTLVIVDSHALIYRAYYAYPPTLVTKDGVAVNAVFGYTSLLLDVISKFLPSNVIAVLDSGEPVERQSTFTQYKANRDRSDDLMTDQIPIIEEMLTALDIPMYKIGGIEADDIIATIDKQFAETFDKTIIVTGDQDLFQLVDSDTFVYLAGRRFSESKLYNEEMVFEKLGIKPLQIPDYKSLAGDASDNIPGVRGIGPKTASSLVQTYSTLEGVYEHIGDITGTTQKKLIENQEIAYLSKSLATVNRDVPLVMDIEDSRIEAIHSKSVKEVIEKYQFRSLLPKIDKLSKVYAPKDGSVSFFDSQEELNISVVKTVEWGGEKLSSKEVFLLSDFQGTDKDPLNWSISKLVFIDGESYKSVSSQSLNKFIEEINDKTIYSFDTKKLIHSLYNIEQTNLPKLYDLGMAGVLIAGGRATNTIASVFHFLGLDVSDSMEINLGLLPELYKNIIEIFKEDTKLDHLFQLESEVLNTVVSMEREGISLDLEFFKNTEEKLTLERDNLQKEIYKDAGHEFNISSPKQVGEVLFVEKSLPAMKKTKGGSFSTDERTLRNLVGVDPIIDNILKFRETEKILGTYVKSIPLYLNPNTQRVHAIFDQLGAVSGRFSSKNPNMQNIPKGEVVGIDIRDGFVSAEGSYLVSFDYSQQELRILAALSNEKIMMDSFNNDYDIHKITAAEIFGIPESEVTPAQRDKGKTINFSIIYGISSFGLSDRMKISRDEATTFISKYYEKYTSVKDFMNQVWAEARQTGYVETILGRRRYSQTINSNNRNLRAAAERETFNLVIQGSAADIMKVAMNSFDDVLKKYSANLLLQIHDEFLFEIKAKSKEDKHLQEFIKEVKEIMVGAYDIGVKYKVEASVGKIWGEMEKVA